MKKKKLFLSLIMAVVMMAFCPTLAWADDYPEIKDGVTTGITVEYTNVKLEGKITDCSTVFKYVVTQISDPIITVSGSGCTWCFIYDEDGNYVTAGWNEEENVDYSLNPRTKKGHTYYICLRPYYNYPTQYNYTVTIEYPCEHTLVHSPAVDFTCTTDGCQEYYYCSECDRYYSKSKGEISRLKGKPVIEAHHIYDQDDKCTVCGLIKGSVFDLSQFNTDIYIYSDYIHANNQDYPYEGNLIFTGNATKQFYFKKYPTNGVIGFRDANIQASYGSAIVVNDKSFCKLYIEGDVVFGGEDFINNMAHSSNFDISGPGNLAIISSEFSALAFGDTVNVAIKGDLVIKAPQVTSGVVNLSVDANSIKAECNSNTGWMFNNIDHVSLHAKKDILLESTSTLAIQSTSDDKIWGFKSIVSDEGDVLFRIGKGTADEAVGVKLDYKGIPAISAGNTKISEFSCKVVSEETGTVTYFGSDPSKLYQFYSDSNLKSYLSLKKDNQGNTVFDVSKMDNSAIVIHDGWFENGPYSHVYFDGHPVFTGTCQNRTYFNNYESISPEHTPILRDLTHQTITNYAIFVAKGDAKYIVEGNVTMGGYENAVWLQEATNMEITGSGNLTLRRKDGGYRSAFIAVNAKTSGNFNIDIDGNLVVNGGKITGNQIQGINIDAKSITANCTDVMLSCIANASLHAKGDITLETTHDVNANNPDYDKIWKFKSISSDNGQIMVRAAKGTVKENVGVRLNYPGVPAVSADNQYLTSFKWKTVNRATNTVTYYGCDPTEVQNIVDYPYNKYYGTVAKELFIKEVAVSIYGNDNNTAAKNELINNGYTVVPRDLNHGCKGGFKIYVGYKTTENPSEAITDLIITHAYHPASFNWSKTGKTYVQARDLHENGNLNRGITKGADLWLYYTKDGNTKNGESLVTSIYAVLGQSSGPEYLVGVRSATAEPEGSIDLNMGAGGDYVYLAQRKEHTHRYDTYFDFRRTDNEHTGPCTCVLDFTEHHTNVNGKCSVCKHDLRDWTLYYKTESGNPISTYTAPSFGARLLSNNNVDGQGYMNFDAPITKINDNVFYKRSDLLSVVIPKTVTSIGNKAFAECANMTKIDFNGIPSVVAAECFSSQLAEKNIYLSDSSYVAADNQFFPELTHIQYKCDMKKGNKYLIILPFDIPLNKTSEYGIFYKYNSMVDNTVYVDKDAVENDGKVKANTAYLFIPANDLTQISVENSRIASDLAEVTPSAAGLYGTYKKSAMPGSVYEYDEGSGVFVQIEGEKEINPFHAFLWLGDDFPSKKVYLDLCKYEYELADLVSLIEVLNGRKEIKVNNISDVDGDREVNIKDVDAIVAELLKGDGSDCDYVDLGLPSGTLWAKMNVGAQSADEYGTYYSWGETKGAREEDPSNEHNYIFNSGRNYMKNYVLWDTYKWCSGSDVNTLTKYNTLSSAGVVDNKTTLDLEDDAAYVNMGEEWRLPTLEEYEELYKNCHWEWAYTYNDKSIQGYVAYKKKNANSDGSAPKYSLSDPHIFFPAGGSFYSNHSKYAEGIRGYYMTNMLDVNNPNNELIFYFQRSYNPRLDETDDRVYAILARAVRRIK